MTLKLAESPLLQASLHVLVHLIHVYTYIALRPEPPKPGATFRDRSTVSLITSFLWREGRAWSSWMTVDLALLGPADPQPTARVLAAEDFLLGEQMMICPIQRD